MGTCIKIILTQYIFLGIFSRVWRRISQSEIRNSAAAESEGGQKFLPPNPLPFCPPEPSVSAARSAPSVSFKKGSDFVKQTHQNSYPALKINEIYPRLIIF